MHAEIVEMTASDGPAVLSFWSTVKGVGLNQSDTPESVAAYLQRNPGFSLIARHEGRLVGAVLCGHDGRRGYLHHLAVAQDCRRQGLGTMLVERCLSKLGACGILKCNIFVYDGNDHGQQFWRQGGWIDRHDLKVMQHPVAATATIDQLQGFLAKMVGLLGARDPLDVLAATAERLRGIVQQHSPAVLRTRPFADKWTPNEILGHLVDNEVVAGFRFRNVLFGHQPIVEGYPQENWVAGQRLNDGDPAEFVTAFTSLRQVNLRIWRGLDDVQLKRVGMRADRGPESVALMLKTLAGHDLSHLDQLQRYLVAICS